MGLLEEFEEMFDLLPLKYKTEENEEYISSLIKSFDLNYDNENYEIAFLNFHLLYMIFIYSVIFKLKILDPEKFYLNLLDFHKNEIKNFKESSALLLSGNFNLFDFSMFGESNFFDFLKILDCTEDEIKNFKKIVQNRNPIAHLNTGRIIINSKEKINSLIEENLEYSKYILLKLEEKKYLRKMFDELVVEINDNFKDFEEEDLEINFINNQIQLFLDEFSRRYFLNKYDISYFQNNFDSFKISDKIVSEFYNYIESNY